LIDLGKQLASALSTACLGNIAIFEEENSCFEGEEMLCHLV